MGNRNIKRNDLLMVISGMLAILFFLGANFYSEISESRVLYGSIQIVINIFVFVTWWKGFQESTGFKKFVAGWGVVVPVVLASVTLYRVILPYAFY